MSKNLLVDVACADEVQELAELLARMQERRTSGSLPSIGSLVEDEEVLELFGLLRGEGFSRSNGSEQTGEAGSEGSDSHSHSLRRRMSSSVTFPKTRTTLVLSAGFALIAWATVKGAEDQRSGPAHSELERKRLTLPERGDTRSSSNQSNSLKLVGLVLEFGDRSLDRKLVSLLEAENVVGHDSTLVVLDKKLKLAFNIGSSDRGVGLDGRLSLLVESLALDRRLDDESRSDGEAGGGALRKSEGEGGGVVVVGSDLLKLEVAVEQKKGGSARRAFRLAPERAQLTGTPRSRGRRVQG